MESTDELPEIRFIRPMPGLGDLTRFVLISLEDEQRDVLYEMRCMEQPSIRFLVAVPSAFFSDYEVELDDLTCSELELAEVGDALVLVILTGGSATECVTANLMAPVVINVRTRMAAQVILSGSDWSVHVPVG